MIEIANEFLRKIFLDLGLEKGQAWLKKGELFGIGVLIRIKLVAGKWLLYQTCQKKKKKWHYTEKFSHVFKQIGLCGLSGSTLTQPIFVRVKFDSHFMRVWFY